MLTLGVIGKSLAEDWADPDMLIAENTETQRGK